MKKTILATLCIAALLVLVTLMEHTHGGNDGE